MSEIRKFLYSGNVDDAFKGIIVVLLAFVWRSKPKRVRSRLGIGIAPGKDYPELIRLSSEFPGSRLT